MKRAFLIPLLLLWVTGRSVAANTSSSAPATATPPSYSLAQCIQIALDHNPELQLASTQFLQAKGQVIQLHAILFPTLNAQGLSTPLVFYVQFQQLFYTHATFPQLRLSRLTEDQAFINYRQHLNDVVFQIHQAFLTMLAESEHIDLLRKAAEEKVKAVSSAQQLFQGGQIQKSVVANVQVQANLSQQNLATEELTYTQAKLLLDTLLGLSLPETAHFTGDLTAKLPENLDTGQLIAEALRDREDLKLLESKQLSAEEQIQIDMKNAYPIIGASSNSTVQPPALAFASDFNAEANYNEPTTVVMAGDTQLPLSLYATWIIYDGGNLRGVKMSDKANIASRDVALSELRQSITGEIGDAVSRILRERDSLKALDAEPSPDDLRRLAETAYEAGQLRQLDKINLENDILTQQLSRLNSEFQLSLAASTLDHALGHGLKITDSRPPQPDR